MRRLAHQLGENRISVTRDLGAIDAVRRARLASMIERDYRFIWRLLRRLGVPSHSVDDGTQQVFLIMAERLDDIQQASERSFAYGTALRVAQDFRRRGQRERGVTVDAEGQPEPVCGAPDPEELTSQRRAREQLDRVLDAMPIELRAVFVLFELEGMTSPEIAEISGLPLGTVASRLRRARERFRELVAQTSMSRVTRGVP